MSKYESLLPSNITSDTFTYNDTTFTISASSIESGEHHDYLYANGAFNNRVWTSANVAPPPLVKIKCR